MFQKKYRISSLFVFAVPAKSRKHTHMKADIASKMRPVFSDDISLKFSFHISLHIA